MRTISIGPLALSVAVPFLLSQTTESSSFSPQIAGAFREYHSGLDLHTVISRHHLDIQADPVGNTPRVAFPVAEKTVPEPGITILMSTLSGPSNTETVHTSYPSPPLVSMAKNSDAAVSGTLTTLLRSALTTDGGFIYSVFSVAVDRVIFDRTNELGGGATITVARAGGSAVIDGKRVYAVDPSFSWFQVGKRYIFYLRRISGATTFKVFSGGTFEVAPKGNIVHALIGRSSLSLPSFASYDNLADEIRLAFETK